MGPKQDRAIRQLEYAFERAQKAGLVFIGMDDTLLVFSRARLLSAGYNDDPHKAMKTCNQGIAVDTHGAYLDSGGW